MTHSHHAPRSARTVIVAAALTCLLLPATARADSLDDIANTLDQFGSGGPMSFFPAIGGALALINSASGFLAMIPGMSGLVQGLNTTMNLINDIQITFGPIMQTSKNIASYVRMASEGKKGIDALFSARDLNDAAATINQLTSLAGGPMAVSGGDLKSNAANVSTAAIDALDTQIRQAQASYGAATDATVRAAIKERLAMLTATRTALNHKLGGVKALLNTQKIAGKSTSIPGQQAQVSAGMMSAAAGATSATATGKLTVAAVTEQTSAVTNSLAGLSQQFTEMAGLQVATNDSLDTMVQSQLSEDSVRATAATMRDEEEANRLNAKYRSDLANAAITKETINASLNPRSVEHFDASTLIFK